MNEYNILKWALNGYRTKKHEKKLKKDLLLCCFFWVAQPGQLSQLPLRDPRTFTRWASQQAASGAREMGDNWHQLMVQKSGQLRLVGWSQYFTTCFSFFLFLPVIPLVFSILGWFLNHSQKPAPPRQKQRFLLLPLRCQSWPCSAPRFGPYPRPRCFPGGKVSEGEIWNHVEIHSFCSTKVQAISVYGNVIVAHKFRRGYLSQSKAKQSGTVTMPKSWVKWNSR